MAARSPCSRTACGRGACDGGPRFGAGAGARTRGGSESPGRLLGMTCASGSRGSCAPRRLCPTEFLSSRSPGCSLDEPAGDFLFFIYLDYIVEEGDVSEFTFRKVTSEFIS